MTLCFEILDAVMVEKILRIQPNVKKLFVLIRANDANSATQRLHNEVIGTELFSVLREKCGQDYFNSFILEKLIPVPGDVACEDLRVEDGAFVCGEREGVILERPFTMGETLNGTSGLDIRVEKRLMEEKLRDLRTENVTEKAATLAMKNFGIQRAIHFGWPNTYSFTKAMGEMVLGHYKGNLPLVIVRPTIITSTYQEPFAGWIEGLR
ncbi:hypothetical protein Vadar_017209 [Vaccinium darrowii]|uniref:Uncharacterized protein n=1 Tax=Vaccinium darrowii TaxID=229202 RepID=A0ACB7XB11_9ERIC|nr:hypothetical protein Vadar_017209 [Vaccinium darrowii]